MALLLCALSYAAQAQGAFYPGPFRVFVVLVAAALVASALRSPWRAWGRRLPRDPLVLAAGGLALVTVLSSALGGAPGDAAGTVALLFTMVAALAVVVALEPEHRRLLVGGVVVLAVVLAVVGWVAVVARWSPDALPSQGLWRAASTLTYENALACFLSAPVLLCFDRVLSAPRRPVSSSAAAFVLLLGMGASLSRGGVLGLAVGTVVLVAGRGARRLWTLWPPVAGAVVAVCFLGPSMPVGAPPHVALAAVGLCFGTVVAVLPPDVVRGRRWAAAGAAALGLGAVALVTGHVAVTVTRSRVSTASSSDRAHEWAAALDLARRHLLLGTGTPHPALRWDAGGTVHTAAYAHNEFLQLLLQDGLLGLLVLVVGLVAMATRLVRLRGGHGSWSAPCALACLAALVVQSALDFLWHVPVIPVLFVVAYATAAAVDDAGSTPDTPAVGGGLAGRARR